MRTLVIIPTYNEKENIGPIIEAVFGREPNVDILVVDDNSPDGTGDLVKEAMAKHDGRLHLLSRSGKSGLGKAYIAGFKWGLENTYDYMVQMDADFSHRPLDLSKILEVIKGNDFVIGSRWVDGGATVNWGVGRKLISRGGSFYSKCILGYPIRDWTGGFNAWTPKVLQAIDLDSIRSEGYSFQIEMKFRAARKGFHHLEVPITFEDRRVGQSKMSFRIVLEALYRVWTIRWA